MDFELTTGQLNVQAQECKIPLEELFDVAERFNPKRTFLFVSKVLGRHIPVAPSSFRHVCRLLADQIPVDLPTPVLFIGMAETAVGLASGVHQEYSIKQPNVLLLNSTRHPQDAELLCEFKEAHSHATDHLLYLPNDLDWRDIIYKARILILVDDEATTGNTFYNLYNALRSTGITQIERIVTVTLTDWSTGKLASLLPLPVLSIALAKGKWNWMPKPNAPIPVMPLVNVTAKGTVKITSQQNWGRLGLCKHKDVLGIDLCCTKNERILILGSGEFVWLPFLLAERLESKGARVHFGALTRSPIAVGLAIHCALSFLDNYGLGITNYLYNVHPEDYDRIILCCETPICSIDPYLIASLNYPEVIAYE